jgi:hypothetical protein
MTVKIYCWKKRAGGGGRAPSSSIRTDGGCPVAHVNDLRSLTRFDPISTLLVVVSKTNWLMSGAVPGISASDVENEDNFHSSHSPLGQARQLHAYNPRRLLSMSASRPPRLMRMNRSFFAKRLRTRCLGRRCARRRQGRYCPRVADDLHRNRLRPYMSAGDTSLRTVRSIKNHVDNDHGNYHAPRHGRLLHCILRHPSCTSIVLIKPNSQAQF